MARPRLKWHTFAGGTGAAEGRNSYQALTPIGDYHIDPVTTKWGRHAGYMVRFANTQGAFRSIGLWSFISAAGDLQNLVREHPVTLPEAKRRCALHWAQGATLKNPARYVYTIQPHDVGKRILPLEGKRVVVEDFMGAVQVRDVGKRIYKSGDVYQIENDEQVMKRMRAKGNPSMKAKRNAPLKGARSIGSNMTEVEHGDLTILYSYKTPVAVLYPGGSYVTTFKHSVTTSKHIGKFFQLHGYTKEKAQRVSQDEIDKLALWGGRVEPASGKLVPWRTNAARKLRSSGRRGRIRQSLRVVSRGVEMDIARAFGKRPISTKRGVKRARRNPAQPSEGPGQNIRNALQMLQVVRFSASVILSHKVNADVKALVKEVNGAAADAQKRLQVALQQIESGARGNPRRNPLALYGANPPKTVRELGRVVEIRYKRKDDGGFYKHGFKTRPRLLALSDGTIAVRP